jgi:hypothetical protein
VNKVMGRKVVTTCKALGDGWLSAAGRGAPQAEITNANARDPASRGIHEQGMRAISQPPKR